MSLLRMLAVALCAATFALPAAGADAPKAGDDPLKSVLLESKEKNRGVAIYINGVTVNAVVVSVDDKYVVAKSQQSSRIVIRLDRIDGVSALF
jgi:hypothetical protein